MVFFGDLEECGQEPEETKAEDTEAEDTGEETEQEAKEETPGTEDVQAFSCGGHNIFPIEDKKIHFCFFMLCGKMGLCGDTITVRKKM